MRKCFFVFCCMVFAVACSNNGNQDAMSDEVKAEALDLSGYIKHNILLINQLGTISIYLPAMLDTFYTYADFGEYHCGETKQFRFAAKKFGPGHDIDNSYSDPTDSIYQLTIIQAYSKDCETNVTIYSAMLNSMKADKGHTYTMLDAKGKKIIVGVHEETQDSMEVAEINAIASISGRPVKFNFQCYRKSVGSFVNQMLTSLKSIEVQENAKGQQQ